MKEIPSLPDFTSEPSHCHLNKAPISLPLLVEAPTNIFSSLFFFVVLILWTVVDMFAFQSKYVCVPFTTQLDACARYVHVLHACVACTVCVRVNSFLYRHKWQSFNCCTDICCNGLQWIFLLFVLEVRLRAPSPLAPF